MPKLLPCIYLHYEAVTGFCFMMGTVSGGILKWNIAFSLKYGKNAFVLKLAWNQKTILRLASDMPQI